MRVSAPDFSIKLNGETYALSVGRITGELALECRKATGMPPMAFLNNADNLDADSAAVIVWLARRQRGERVRLDAVMREVTIDAILPPDEVAPEAPLSNDERATVEAVVADPEAGDGAS